MKDDVHWLFACVADALNLLHTNGLDECVGRLQRRLLIIAEMLFVSRLQWSVKKYRDVNWALIVGLECALGGNYISILWHSNCYAQYSSKEESERLQQTFFEHADECAEKDTGAPASFYATRSQAGPVHESKCIFCQSTKERLSSVVLANFRSSPSHHNVRFRVAGECDLVSAGAKYHPACLHSFQGSTEKILSSERKETDLHLTDCTMNCSMQRRNGKSLTWHMPEKGTLL